MDKFIKVSLTGSGWSQSESGKQHDHARFANLIADYLHRLEPLDGRPIKSRDITISVCDQVDTIHFLDSDEKVIFSI